MKKVLSFVLIAMMAVSALTGCGGTSSSDNTASGDSTGSTENSGAVVVSENPDDWEVITVACVPTQEVTDEAMVEEAMNAHLEEINAGVKMDIIPIQFGNLATTMTLMLTTPDDAIDVFTYSFFSSLSNVVSNEQVIALDDYLPLYPELVETIGEENLVLQQINGVQYALPVVGSLGYQIFYCMRSDVAETIGYADKNGEQMTLREITDMLIEAKAAYPNMISIPVSDYTLINEVDTLGDSNMLGVLLNYGLDNTEVVNFYDTDEFRTYLDYCYEWEANGLFLDDPLNQELSKTHIKTGLSIGCFQNGISAESVVTDMTTMAPSSDVTFCAYPFTDLVATSTSAAGSGYCISSVSSHPDEAMKMLSLMYTDETVMRLLAQGIEGVHYVVDDNGCSWYPEGETMATLGWGTGAQWYFPNQTLCIPFQTDNADYYKEMLASNDECLRSQAIGFTFDNSSVYNEYTACSSAVDEYLSALVYAQVDRESYYQSFLDELNDAGIDKVIAEKQAQLDALLGK